MKTIIRIAAVSGTLFLSGIAFSQETAPAPVATPATTKDAVAPAAQPVMAAKPRPADGWRGIPLGMIIKQVGLTPEQTQQGKELNGKYTKQYQGIDQNMPLDERKVKVKEMMDQRETELKAILTPEQQEKYANMRTPSGAMRHEGKAPADGKMQAKPRTMKEASPATPAEPLKEKK